MNATETKMSMHGAVQLPGGSDSLGSNGLAHVADQLRNSAEASLEFQSLLLDIQKQYSNFHMIVQAKQESTKSMADIARDSIRKSAER